MKRKYSTTGSRRVSLRTIATTADVSVMTVSYALRNSSEVSPPERQRILQIAKELGYRPDPLLTHLMEHLRSQRTTKSAANLAVLTMLDAHFVRRLIQGAAARAERLGYRLDRINALSYVDNPRPLTRSLLARGVSGILLAPAVDAANFSTLLDWSKFAAVAMTYSVVEPHVHRVVTHHFDNAVRTFSLMEQRGYRRIGFVMTRDMEFRTNHSYSGAYHRAYPATGDARIPILMLDESGPKGIRTWFARHRPDAIVASNAAQVSEILCPAIGVAASARTAFVCLDYEADKKVSGMDQLFETVGGHAIDALVAQIHRNERGLPEDPTVTMVRGRWRDSFGHYPMKTGLAD